MSYCVKCRSKTRNVNPQMVVSANGRAMMKSQCGVCGTKKSEFVKGSATAGAKKGKGFGRLLGGIISQLPF